VRGGGLDSAAPLRRVLVLHLLAILAWTLALPTHGAVQEAVATKRVDLEAAEEKVFSQYGEDGVIERIFETIEPTNRFVVEFGASDGIEHSNARNLILNRGWSAFLIEGNRHSARDLVKNYADYPAAKTLEAWVYPGNIEILFEENGVPPDLDLLVIDIDSNDYYVWRAIHDFRPKVVMIEVNIHYPPPQLMVIDFHPMNYWDKKTAYLGASLQSYSALAKKKGYELIYCMSYGPNCFFVDEKYYARFGIEDNSPASIFTMWQAPKGPTEFPPGQQTLKWGSFEIQKKLIFDR